MGTTPPHMGVGHMGWAQCVGPTPMWGGVVPMLQSVLINQENGT
jgi:hypothetical protein